MVFGITRSWGVEWVEKLDDVIIFIEPQDTYRPIKMTEMYDIETAI